MNRKDYRRRPLSVLLLIVPKGVAVADGTACFYAW